MMRTTLLGLIVTLAALSNFAGAEDKPAGHRCLVAGAGNPTVAILGTDGKIEWSYPSGNCNDAWMLPSGNVLFAYQGGAKEVTPEKKVVWEYKVTDEPVGNEIHAVQRLPDGNTLVAQNGHPPRLLEIDPKGEILQSIVIKSDIANAHAQFRQVRKTKAGTYLGGLMTEGRVNEYDADGEVLRTFEVPRHGFASVRLPDGNTLIACGDGHTLIEFDKDGREVWKVEENDIPGNPLRFVGGVQRLPNGNTVIANWLGHGGHTGKQPQLFEITRDKKLVWQVWDAKQFGNLSTVQVLDVEGEPLR
ncbi:MAG: hypothetical protein HQ581_11060 [Planctomycetes bacterium]|nr:hypothetical protein [Planctomycetota bacterium]